MNIKNISIPNSSGSYCSLSGVEPGLMFSSQVYSGGSLFSLHYGKYLSINSARIWNPTLKDENTQIIEFDSIDELKEIIENFVIFEEI